MLTMVTACVLMGRVLLDFGQAASPSVGGRMDFLLYSSLRISLFTCSTLRTPCRRKVDFSPVKGAQEVRISMSFQAQLQEAVEERQGLHNCTFYSFLVKHVNSVLLAPFSEGSHRGPTRVSCFS